jgi:hypothetical protein
MIVQIFCRFGLSLKLHAPFHPFGTYHTIQRMLRQVGIGEEGSPLCPSQSQLEP